MSEHVIKSWPEFFQGICDGTKRHELRRNDRGYEVGDILLLREYDPHWQEYTGREARAEITSVTSANVPCAESKGALHPDFCILSIRSGATE